MTTFFEQQRLAGLKDFLRQQLYDAFGQAVPVGINRELTRIVDARLRDVFVQNARPHVEQLIETVAARTVETIRQNYDLVPKMKGGA